MMRAIVTALGLMVLAGACAPVTDPSPGTATRWTPRPIDTRTFTPAVSGADSATATANQPAPARQDHPGPPRRRGSSTPPPALNDPGPPRLAPLPTVPGSEDATARFKQDLMRPETDRMRTDDALGRLPPSAQRDLLMRDQEMHRLETDPLRR